MISEKFPMQLANLARTVVRRAMTLYKIDIAKCGIGGEIRKISLSEIRLSNLLLFAVVLCVFFSQGQVLHQQRAEQLSAKLVWLVWIACIENSRIIVF